MCAYLQRSGFRVLSGERFAHAPDALPVFPDAFLLRVETPPVGGAIRSDFLLLERLRHAAPDVRLVLFLAHGPNPEEQQMARRFGAVYARTEDGQRALVRLLRDVTAGQSTT
jgi:hypothetical protein